MRKQFNFEDIFTIKDSNTVALEVAQRVKRKRKEMKLTQEGCAKKSGVSFGSIKRFETKGEISFTSLIKIAIALECETDFEELFAKKHYNSIQEVIDENNNTKPRNR